jgi:hypothetical protein
MFEQFCTSPYRIPTISSMHTVITSKLGTGQTLQDPCCSSLKRCTACSNVPRRRGVPATGGWPFASVNLHT